MNWLRAKQRRDRWKEELLWVRYEADWTIRWFKHMEDEWNQRGLNACQKGLQGHQIHAEKQKNMWRMLKEDAKRDLAYVRIEDNSMIL